MQDGCGRSIDYLRLSVTDLCNYRCRYCMPESGVEKRPHGAILSIEELAEIARAAVGLGVTKIRLTGGEPLVRKGILDLCRQLRSIPEFAALRTADQQDVLRMAVEIRKYFVKTKNRFR